MFPYARPAVEALRRQNEVEAAPEARPPQRGELPKPAPRGRLQNIAFVGRGDLALPRLPNQC